MKLCLVLLVCPVVLLVSASAQSHRFAQPVRRRRIDPNETTDAKESDTEEHNNAGADKDLEVKRLIDLMKVNERSREPGSRFTAKTSKHESEKKKAQDLDRTVSKQIRNGVGQSRGEPVINRQHSASKIRTRGRQIPTRNSEAELEGKNRKPQVGEDKTTKADNSHQKKFRLKSKSSTKTSRTSEKTFTSESGEHTYPTEKLIIRVPKVELEQNKDFMHTDNKAKAVPKEGSRLEANEESNKSHSLGFLTEFLKSYEENSGTTTQTPKVTIPSKQDRDSLLSDMLNSSHKLASDRTEKIDDIKPLDGNENIQKQIRGNGRRGGIKVGRKPSQSEGLENPGGSSRQQSERRRGQHKSQSNQSVEQIGKKTNKTKGLRKPVGSSRRISGRDRGQSKSNSDLSEEQIGINQNTEPERYSVGFTRKKSGRRVGQQKLSSEELSKEVKVTPARKNHAPVFRSNKETINNIYNIIEQAEHIQSDIMKKSEETISNKSPIHGRKKEHSEIIENVNDRDQPESVKNPSLEIKPSNLFLSTFMGFQRTKRPQKAPSTENDKDKNYNQDQRNTQTDAQTKADSKYPKRHRFSPGVTKPEPTAEEERPGDDNSGNKSQSRPVNPAIQNIRGRNSLFSRKPFRPSENKQKVGDETIKSDLRDTDKSTLNDKKEIKENKKVSQSRSRFGVNARERPRSIFGRPNTTKKEQTGITSTSTITHNEALLTQEGGNARSSIHKQEPDRATLFQSRTTGSKKEISEDNDEKSIGNLSPVRLGTRGRGGHRTEPSIVEVQTSSPVFLPTARPLPAQKKIEYSEIVRHGQGRPVGSFDQDIVNGQEKDNKYPKLGSSQGRHGLQGRGRSRGVARGEKPVGSQTEGGNSIEESTSTFPSHARFSIPETRRTNPSEIALPSHARFSIPETRRTNLSEISLPSHARFSIPEISPDLATRPQTPRFSVTSYTSEASPKEKNYPTTEQNNKRKDNSEPIPTSQSLETASEANSFSDDIAGSKTDRQSQNNDRDSTLDHKKEEIRSKSKFQRRGRPSTARHQEETRSTKHREDNKENVQSQVSDNTQIQKRGRTRGSLIRNQANVKSSKFPESEEEEKTQSRSETQTRGRTRGSLLRKQGSIQSDVSQAKKSSQSRGRARGSNLIKPNEENSTGFSSTEDYTEDRKESKHRGRSRESIAVKQNEIESTGFSSIDDQTEEQKETQLRGTPKGSLHGKEYESTSFSVEENEMEQTEEKKETPLRGRSRDPSPRNNEHSKKQNENNVERKEAPFRGRSRGALPKRKEEVQSTSRADNHIRGRFRGSQVRDHVEVKLSGDLSNENTQTSFERERDSSKVNEADKLQSKSDQQVRSRSRGRPNALAGSAYKTEVRKTLQEVTSTTTSIPQVIEYQRPAIGQFSGIFTTTLKPEYREILFTEDVGENESLLSFDPFSTPATPEPGLQYTFFPADTAYSKENFKLYVLDKPDIQTEFEDLSSDDLSVHLSSALNLATVTWTQDPYRGEEEGRPIFDIDFSKNPSQQ